MLVESKGESDERKQSRKRPALTSGGADRFSV
jgi:hypothetical protein